MLERATTATLNPDMSFAFWLNVALAVAGFVNAFLDHGQTLTDFREATTGRFRLFIKLVLIWGMAVISIVALPFTAWESIATDRKIERLERLDPWKQPIV